MILIAFLPMLAFLAGALLTGFSAYYWYLNEKPRIIHNESVRCYREFEKLLNQAFLSTVEQLTKEAMTPSLVPAPDDRGFN